jgi:hypothetical protein
MKTDKRTISHLKTDIPKTNLFWQVAHFTPLHRQSHRAEILLFFLNTRRFPLINRISPMEGFVIGF